MARAGEEEHGESHHPWPGGRGQHWLGGLRPEAGNQGLGLSLEEMYAAGRPRITLQDVEYPGGILDEVKADLAGVSRGFAVYSRVTSPC